MQVWPAIDIRDGKCVRLVQGDYSRETIFGDSPLDMARQWIDQGADRLHIVDLDAARTPYGQAVTTSNSRVIAEVVARTGVVCQVGGGMRTEADIRRAIDAGVHRVICGTQAVLDPGWLETMARLFPGRLIAGIDARNGKAATAGWEKDTQNSAIELAREFSGLPIAAIIYTDIARDGLLAGPNFDAMHEMAAAVKLEVIASGGVTTSEDITRLADCQVSGCIVGRALYEGRLTVTAAVAAARAGETGTRHIEETPG